MKKCRSLQPKTSGVKRTAETLSCNRDRGRANSQSFPPFYSCFREASILLLPTVVLLLALDQRTVVDPQNVNHAKQSKVVCTESNCFDTKRCRAHTRSIVVVNHR